MVIKIASNLPSFLSSPISLSPTNTTEAKLHGFNYFELKQRRRVVYYYDVSLFVLFGRPPSTTDAILATIFGGGQAICQKQDELYNKINDSVILSICIKPRVRAIGQPLRMAADS